jgi:hypothetical protein
MNNPPYPPAADDPDDDDDGDLWFLPGPPEDEPAHLPPGPQAEEITEAAVLGDWQRAEASLAARLARVAGRLGALDDRVRRGPEGWRHRLALIEAAELSWFSGDRLTADRLALWIALRLSGVQEDAAALARVGWAVRRLTGGPGPDTGLSGFLGRHDPTHEADDPYGDPFTGRADSWQVLMQSGGALHPITRACMGFHLWALAGLGQQGDRLEAAVTAARIATGDGEGAVFAPLAMGGAGGLRAGGAPPVRLARWLEGMESALLAAMRHLDQIEDWSVHAATVMAPLSGRTPALLRSALTDWPLLSAPMAEALTGASRAAVQRNLTWMEGRGLIREVTGQGRFRMWRAAV